MTGTRKEEKIREVKGTQGHRKQARKREKTDVRKMKEIEKQNRVDRSKNKIEGLAKDSFLEHLPQTF